METRTRAGPPTRHAPRLSEQAAGRLLADACARAGATLLDHRLRSIHHRGHRSVSHVHDVDLWADGSVRRVLLVLHADAGPLPAKAMALTSEGGRVAVWRFPHDPYLPDLGPAVDLHRVRRLLDHLGVGPGKVGLRTRVYRPTRRAVVEVTVTGGDGTRRALYLKVLPGDRARAVADRHRELAAHAPVPAVVGVSSTGGTVVLDALQGRTLRDALADGDPVPEPAEIVAVSRRLMDSGLRSDRSPRAFADPARHVARLCELVPEEAETVRAVARAAGDIEAGETVVHGDLHAGQLLVRDGHLTGLLDVDGAGTGLLAHDAGSLVAYLRVLGELRPRATVRIEDYADRISEAYTPLVGARGLARATAGAWLALATSAHRSQEPGWPATTKSRIARAAASLEA